MRGAISLDACANYSAIRKAVDDRASRTSEAIGRTSTIIPATIHVSAAHTYEGRVNETHKNSTPWKVLVPGLR